MQLSGEMLQYYLSEALKGAQEAFDQGDVPVGALVVKDGDIISRAHNCKEKNTDVMGHAEVLAIQKAVSVIGDWRLNDCLLVSTLEPCPMCAGTMLQARLGKLVYGAYDLKWGAHHTKVNLLESDLFNHRVEVEYVQDDRCSEILTRFFKQLRT